MTSQHVPLMCIINFLGYVVVVTSIVPLGQRTLIYGKHLLELVLESCNTCNLGTGDRGVTVHDSDPKMSDMMRKVALSFAPTQMALVVD
jgi:hypothetical protein